MQFRAEPDPLAHPELGVLIATLEDSTREWREHLGEVLPQAVTWQPYENGPSIGAQILHMVDCECAWLRVVANQEPEDLTAPETQYSLILDQEFHIWPAPPQESLDWYLEIQDRRRAENIELIRQHADPNSLHGDDPSYTYRWIVAHLVEHDAYHGGQIVLLHEMFKRAHA